MKKPPTVEQTSKAGSDCFRLGALDWVKAHWERAEAKASVIPLMHSFLGVTPGHDSP
jgi:hypothetical protein